MVHTLSNRYFGENNSKSKLCSSCKEQQHSSIKYELISMLPLPAVRCEPGKSLTFPSPERKGIEVPDYVLVSAQTSAINEHGGANVSG